MKPILPYKNVKQHTRISIEPYQMNSDIRNHMKLNLKKKVEKKCNNNGFVDEVHKIINSSDGILSPENLSGNVIYDVTYHCRLYLPTVHTVIIGQVKLVNLELIVTVHGPIMTFIPKINVDTDIWDINENYTNKKKNTKLNVGDFVLIFIVNTRINQNDTQIKTIGKLLDYASESDVHDYYEQQEENTDDSFIM